ncbi:MAG: nuclease domain-containing protein, partial [Opitutia bacterium]
ITYIHFDAKFRIANLDLNLAGDSDSQSAVSVDDEAKPEDVYKMHTYNEAIRGTAASVILFPGGKATEGGLHPFFSKYRELIPGVGALAISPGNHEVRSKALAAIREYLSKALLLTPKSMSSYARMRDWEVSELRELKD